MIKRLIIIQSHKLDPYYNQAIEASLHETVESEVMILYIWANDKTVFIGKNQNAYAECNVQKLKDAGGFLARRLSGGGAVYHDKGNLNFTFICTKDNYSLADNFEVVLDAVKSFGISAEFSGRNDCTVEGKKFSGNAFYSSNNKCFHHGTILINTMASEIANYLNVSERKLAVKGIKSVSSRVTNLCEHNQFVSFDTFADALKTSFMRHWQQAPVTVLKTSDIDDILIKKWQSFFSDTKRIMGDDVDYNFRMEHRFDWGLADIRLQINDGVIEKAKIYTDSLLCDMTRKERALIGENIYSYDDCEVSDILLALNEMIDK